LSTMPCPNCRSILLGPIGSLLELFVKVYDNGVVKILSTVKRTRTRAVPKILSSITMIGNIRSRLRYFVTLHQGFRAVEAVDLYAD